LCEEWNITTSIGINYSNDPELLSQHHPLVEVYDTIQAIREVLYDILDMVDSKEYDAAICTINESIEKLERVKELDNNQIIVHLLDRLNTMLEDTEIQQQEYEDEMENKQNFYDFAKSIHYMEHQVGVVHRKCF